MNTPRVVISVCASALVVVAILSGSTPSQADTSDPGAVVHEFCTALNAHDANVAMSFFDPVSMVQVSEGPQQSRDQIRGWLDQLTGENVRVELLGQPQLTWDAEQPRSRVAISWTAMLAMDRYRELGFVELNGTVGAIVKDGKITFLEIRPTPDWQESSLASGLTPR